MKILYGIQGTGHGHISRAREILPILTYLAEIDVLISGNNIQMNLEDITVSHKQGISFAYDSKGSVSILKTAQQLKPIRFISDVKSLNVQKYDLIISDYEPITAWASKNSKTPSIALSHQASFLSDKSPRPQHKSLFAEKILKYFAPCDHALGFHFQEYDSFINPPVIRKEVRDLITEKHNHVSVYLPAFHDQMLVSKFLRSTETDWHIFSPFCKKSYQKKNVWVQPVGNKPFLKSMQSGIGVLTSAGFETCAETMYLGKKLMTIPIKNQYEQLCNAAALKKMGVPVMNKIEDFSPEAISKWLNDTEIVQLRQIADMDNIISRIIQLAAKTESFSGLNTFTASQKLTA